MAAKKEKIDPRALRLKKLRGDISDLEKEAKLLRAEILKDFPPGTYPGFAVVEKFTSRLDVDHVEEDYGCLDAYRRSTPALYIEFSKG